MICSDALVDRIATLRAVLDAADGTDGLLGPDLGEARRVLDLLQQEQNRALRVAIIGEFSSGKSTFVNAVIGQDLLPARFLPTTRQIMRIMHSDGPGYVTLASDDAEASSRIEQRRPLSPAAVAALAATGEPLDITVPIPPPWSGLVVYDTPGVNDATTMAEGVLIDLMDAVDAVVLMLRAQQPLTSTEAGFLADLVRHKDLGKFFFCINFSDCIDPRAGEEVRSHVALTLGTLRNWPIGTLRERVFLCSAKHTLDTTLRRARNQTPGSPDELPALLAAVHEWASASRRALLDDAAESHLRVAAQIALSCIDAAIDGAVDRDAEIADAVRESGEIIARFRIEVREQELALRQRISASKIALLSDLAEAFAGIDAMMRTWITTARMDDLAGEGPANRLQIAVQDRVVVALKAFLTEFADAVGDLEVRLAPVVATTSNRLEGMREQFDIGPLLAGSSLSVAGYLAVMAALPWAIGATGVVVATVGLTSLIPGVGGTVGALLGAGIGGLASSAPRAAAGLAGGIGTSYRALRDVTRNWQSQTTRDAYARQASALVAELHGRITATIEAEVDPSRIVERVMSVRFPDALILEERQLATRRLDREKMRTARGELTALRKRLLTVMPVTPQEMR